jgi:hypothetical protein
MAMPGTGRSLGGYGAATISSYYGGTAGGYMPYNGGGSGYLPYRGGSAGGMGVQPIPRRLPESTIGGVMMPTTPIGGASLSGGMGANARPGMGTMARSGPRSFTPFGYETGMSTMSGASATRRAPSGPGFGYPFRMPPSLTGTSSMSMP